MCFAPYQRRIGILLIFLSKMNVLSSSSLRVVQFCFCLSFPFYIISLLFAVCVLQLAHNGPRISIVAVAYFLVCPLLRIYEFFLSVSTPAPRQLYLYAVGFP